MRLVAAWQQRLQCCLCMFINPCGARLSLGQSWASNRDHNIAAIINSSPAETGPTQQPGLFYCTAVCRCISEMRVYHVWQEDVGPSGRF